MQTKNSYNTTNFHMEFPFIPSRSSTGVSTSLSPSSLSAHNKTLQDSISEITDRVAKDIIGSSGASVKTRRAAVQLSQPSSKCAIL